MTGTAFSNVFVRRAASEISAGRQCAVYMDAADGLRGASHATGCKRRIRLHDPVGAVLRVGWRIFEAPSDQFHQRFNAYAAVEKLNHFLQRESGAFARGRQLPDRSY